MDCGELEEEQEILKGIIALLLGLAALAQLLCVLPLPLRVLLLPPLRRAEAATRAFAIEQAGGGLALPLALVRQADGDSCAEAMRLARCFRALATILGFYDGSQDFGMPPPFRGRPNRRLAQRAPGLAWPGNFMMARRAMAFGEAGRIDTS